VVQQIPIYGKYGVTLPRLNRKDVFHCGSHTLVYVKYKDVEPYIMETATTGIPKLPPCSCCYAGKFCHVGIIPDTYMCYDAWRQLRAGA